MGEPSPPPQVAPLPEPRGRPLAQFERETKVPNLAPGVVGRSLCSSLMHARFQLFPRVTISYAHLGCKRGATLIGGSEEEAPAQPYFPRLVATAMSLLVGAVGHFFPDGSSFEGVRNQATSPSSRA